MIMKLSAGVAIGLISMVGSMIGSYYTNIINTNAQIASAKETINSDISSDRERVSKLEEAVSTIKLDVQDIKKGQVEVLTYIKSR